MPPHRHADTATPMLPGCRRHTAASATLPLRPHCRCHTAAAPSHARIVLANATPAAVVPAAHCCYHTRRLHACRCHTRRFPDRHRHAGTGQPHRCHTATATGPLVTPHPPQPRPPWDPHPLIVHPSPEAAGKWPEDTSNPLCMASTRAHAGWFTRRCVELPSTKPPTQLNPFKTTLWRVIAIL